MTDDCPRACASDRPRSSASAQFEVHLIDSPTAPQARRIADVLRAGGSARRTFLIDEVPNIVQAARHGVEIQALYVTDGSEISSELLEVFTSGVPPIYRLTPHVAASLFGRDRRPRTFALGRGFQRRRLEELAARYGDIVVLDGVRLTGNIGAIARTASAFGAAGIVLINSGVASPVDRRLIRASRGTVFSLPLILATSEEVIAFTDSHRIPLISLAAASHEPIDSIHRLGSRIAIVLGSERFGPSAAIESAAAAHLRIPMTTAVESLNVSVAAGIALFNRRIDSLRR